MGLGRLGVMVSTNTTQTPSPAPGRRNRYPFLSECWIWWPRPKTDRHERWRGLDVREEKRANDATTDDAS